LPGAVVHHAFYLVLGGSGAGEKQEKKKEYVMGVAGVQGYQVTKENVKAMQKERKQEGKVEARNFKYPLCYPVTTLLLPCGNLMGTLWEPIGNPVASGRHPGYRIDIAGILLSYTLHTPLILP